MKTINLDEIKKLTVSSKERIATEAERAEKKRKLKEKEERKKSIAYQQDVSFFVELITEAAKKGKNTYSICLYGGSESFTGDVLLNGKFNQEHLSTYEEMQIVHMKAIAKKLKEFSPRIYVKTVDVDNGMEYLYSESSNVEFREWKQNHTYIEFNW